MIVRHVTFIGITGSCGKTSAKELAHAVVASRYATRSNTRGRNIPHHLVSMMLRIRPWHSHSVVEMGAGVDDRLLSRSLRLVAPKIGIVTMVGTDHLSTFGSIEEIAKEKSKLVRALPPNGTAILNADDPRVMTMASLHQGRVITYGTGAEAMVRGTNIRSAWPGRLSLDVTHEGRTRRVETQLCGVHLVPACCCGVRRDRRGYPHRRRHSRYRHRPTLQAAHVPGRPPGRVHPLFVTTRKRRP